MTTSPSSVKGRPATPEEIVVIKTAVIPDFVFDAFNEMIAQKWDGRSAKVIKDDVVDAILHRMPGGYSANFRYDVQSFWLDVEESYRAAGWKVMYDRPAYDETYQAYYVFTKK